MSESVEDELMDELVRGWVEMYKKSATTRVLLRLVADQGPVDTATIATKLAVHTGWDLAERGLYRSLQRLSGLGLLIVDERPGNRTGARRHFYEISGRGSAYLERIEAAQVA